MKPAVFRKSRPLALFAAVLVSAVSLWPGRVSAAGTLTPQGAPQQPIQIRDHAVNVSILAGFSKTDVQQTFFNPNARDLEAIYAFPVPKSAALSEVIIYAGEQEIRGEVLPKAKANQLYEGERSRGNDAGVANKNDFETFEFKVAKVPAQAETRIRFVYYQPLQIDAGVGRYVYPLEDGGTDEAAKSFWVPNAKVENKLTLRADLRLEYPIADVRVPGFEGAAKIERPAEGEVRVAMDLENASLNRDLVLYYRLAENLPGRVELLTYRADPSKPGTFMVVTTPGIDLKALDHGADYVFVLDISGSMQGKLRTLAQGVKRSFSEMRPHDRFRIVTFSSTAGELTAGWQRADAAGIARAAAAVEALNPQDSTNVYAGLELALRGLDNDRVTSLILVTDGVANTGVLDPREFARLLKQYDVRVFGFLMGNNANWPLMEEITAGSGGFYAGISNADDIIGQILLAQSKIRFEALHDAELSIDGGKTFELTDQAIGKVYRGQQLVLFGRYAEAGKARLTLKAKLSGEDKTYQAAFDFPETDTAFPEIERLWALKIIEQIQHQTRMGALAPQESQKAVEDLGVAYQLVTDETSMSVLRDEAFSRHGIERRNRERTAREAQAQTMRAQRPVQSRRVDGGQPMFKDFAPSLGGGGGAVDPFSAALLLGLPALGALLQRRKGRRL